jgi:hypothetical protein
MSGMGDDDWYRSAAWDAEAQQHLEAKLARARRESRPQYLRLKALALLATDDERRRQAGVALLERVLADFPDDRVQAAGAHVALGRYFEEAGDAARGARHLRAALRLQEGTNVRWGAELLLAELIVRHGLEADDAEADELLDRVLAAGPIFRSEQFRYAVARMRLAHRRGRPDEAAAYACGALHLFEHNEPASPRHPTVGLIRADDATLDELHEIARNGDPEAFSERVERFRRPDGGVEWAWALTKRLRDLPGDVRQEAQDAFDDAAEPLIQDLRDAGFEVYDLRDWSARRLPSAAAVKAAAPVLLRRFEETDDVELKTTIAGALNDRRFRRYATGPLIAEFRRLRGVGRQRMLKDRVAAAIATLARDEHFEDIAALLRDPAHGHYRSYLTWTLPHMKTDEAVDVALELLEDDELHTDALRALAELRSRRTRPVLERIAGQDDQERARIDIARRGLEKLAKAEADGKARP